jgi:hypothetical protein
VVAAVEQVKRERGGRSWLASGSARLAVISDTTTDPLCGFVEQVVAPGAPVITDGWSSYRALGARGFDHRPTTLDHDYVLAAAVQPKVHLLFSNLEAMIVGTFHGVSIPYVGRYTDEFIYRFNRRKLEARGSSGSLPGDS